jgi:dipeptidyl aminopeptidase/acylaminoacyl peptidase
MAGSSALTVRMLRFPSHSAQSFILSLFVASFSVVGQYPDFFSGTALRNPVTAVGECASVSDIPDWSHLEFGRPFLPTTTVTPSTFAVLQEASPIAHVDKMKTPVLLLVGEGDRRVPPPQALALYHALKGRGVEVDMLTFPGNGHALDGVEAQRVSWETTIEWFDRYAKRE